jgi:hypothetical protein
LGCSTSVSSSCSLLTAAEQADRRELGVTVEPEPAHQRNVGVRRLTLVAGHGVAYAPVAVELASELVVVADAHRRAAAHHALPRFGPSGDHVEQRRLAGAVGTDHPDAVTRLEADRHSVEHRRVAISPPEAHALQFDARGPEPLRAEFEVQRTRPGGSISSSGDQRGCRGDARFRLAGACRRTAP